MNALLKKLYDLLAAAEFGAAETMLERLTVAGADIAELRCIRASLLLIRGKPDEADRTVAELEADDGFARANLALAEAAAQRGQFDIAHWHIRQTQRQSPTTGEMIGELFPVYRSAGEPRNLLALASKALAYNPACNQLRLRIAELQLELGDWAEAMQTLRAGVEIDPCFPGFHLKLLEQHLINGQVRDAADILVDLLTLEPSPDLARQMRPIMAAALSSDPVQADVRPHVLRALSVICAVLGDDEEALSFMEKSIRIAPKLATPIVRHSDRGAKNHFDRYLMRVFLDNGYYRSFLGSRAIDGSGTALPWYSYPAIDYIRGIDLRDRDIFEFGAGQSTRFWATCCRHVTSVENNAAWCAELEGTLPANVTLMVGDQSPEHYLAALLGTDRRYDVIVVDGDAVFMTRIRMAEAALQRLKPDGVIILDNSDCHVRAAAVLRAADLLQVDMSGFAPGNPDTQCTSFFFTRDFRAPPAAEWQPIKTVGAMLHYRD